MNFLLALLVSRAAFLRMTVTRVRIFRFRLRIRNFFLESLTLRVTLPLAAATARRHGAAA